MLRNSDFADLAAAVDKWRDELVGLSHGLHAEPEIGWQEHVSAGRVAELAERAGFAVTRGVAGMQTAMIGVAGSGSLPVALCVEYDALPAIGHGCGHNVNAAAATGAAIALAAVADRLDLRVKLIGTPAEETSGGKIDLIHAGAFDDVALAGMVHAGAEDCVNASSLAVSAWRVEFDGRPAHAATAPWQGVNALDAATLAYTAIGLLRQQLPPSTVVSFVIAEGGRVANVIPDRAVAHLEVRAPDLRLLREVTSRVHDCLEAGEKATGARLTTSSLGHEFAELRQDRFLSEAYARALRRLGRVAVDAAGAPVASTDMGNVSQLMPALHPTIGYDVGGAAHHTAEFARHSVSASADRAVGDGALALAAAVAEAASEESQRARLIDGMRQRADSAAGVTS